MSKFRYAGIEAYDINNGKGFGVTLFVQGCPHHCPGCHNPQTWDFNGGKPLTADVIMRLQRLFADDNIVRLTLSGGEPFANIEVSYSIGSMFKQISPQKRLWIYTGYKFEDLGDIDGSAQLLNIADVVVDGPFLLDKRDLTLPFRGSSNQRIIDVRRSIESGEPVLCFE